MQWRTRFLGMKPALCYIFPLGETRLILTKRAMMVFIIVLLTNSIHNSLMLRYSIHQKELFFFLYISHITLYDIYSLSPTIKKTPVIRIWYSQDINGKRDRWKQQQQLPYLTSLCKWTGSSSVGEKQILLRATKDRKL